MNQEHETNKRTLTPISRWGFLLFLILVVSYIIIMHVFQLKSRKTPPQSCIQSTPPQELTTAPKESLQRPAINLTPEEAPQETETPEKPQEKISMSQEVIEDTPLNDNIQEAEEVLPKEPAVIWPDIKIASTIISQNSENSLAIINGKILSANSTIEGAQVLSIQKTGAILIYEGEEKTFTVTK